MCHAKRIARLTEEGKHRLEYLATCPFGEYFEARSVLSFYLDRLRAALSEQTAAAHFLNECVTPVLAQLSKADSPKAAFSASEFLEEIEALPFTADGIRLGTIHSARSLLDQLRDKYARTP